MSAALILHSRVMFNTAINRPWICTNCIQRYRQGRRLLATAASQCYQPRPVPVNNSPPGAQHDDKTLRQIFDFPNFWNEFSQSSKYAYNGRRSGLFKNRYLTDPQGFDAFASTSLTKAKRLVDKILAASSIEGYKNVVRDLDRLSDLLCRVIDLADFVRSSHPDYKIQAAATKCHSMMYEYMNVLNTTKGLDKQLNIAMNTPEVVASWTEEELVVGDILRRDFAKSAIDLPRAERAHFVRLSQEISQDGLKFSECMEPAKVSVTFPSSTLKGMDPMLVREYTTWGQVTLPSVGGVSAAALRSVQDEDARKEIFIASRTASEATLDMLETMLKKRAELAKLSRFESYGHMNLSDKMAKSPESVNQFLAALTMDNGSIVRLEIAELLKAKMSNPNAASSILQPWDKDYYMAQIVSSIPPKIRNPDFISAFFSLGTVMQGLSRLFTRLYGIRFVPNETAPGETWNPDVRRLDVVSETDGHVAVLYCDLFSRPGKSPNPAHFTLRCSREIREDELAEAALSLNPLFASPEEAVNDGMATSKAHGKLKQLPTIALICDFHTNPYNSTQPSLLSFSEVTTLFHEMGHASHSILGRTSLQNVSGTRCATDFSELPSILMESFASDPKVLSLFARHYETDQTLPFEMVAEQLAREKRFEGSETESQIVLAMADQAYHSSLPLSSRFNSTQIYHDLQRQYGELPTDPPGTCWQGFFGHLFGYGSTYYSYLFDKVLAKRIWQVVFASGQGGKSVDRESGERMKESVLKWGGGRDPWKCLSEVLNDGRVENGDQKAMSIVGGWGVKGGKI